MDAANKPPTNSRLLFLIALALVLAAPGWSQAPAFSLPTSTISFNQSFTGTDLSVGSTGAPITFTASKSYAADGGGDWLGINQAGPTTPTSIALNVVRPPAVAGTYTATLTLTSSSPAGITGTITVTFLSGSGGGGGGGSSTITASPTSVPIAATAPNLGFGNVLLSTTSVSPISISAVASTTSGGNWLTPSLTTSSISSGSTATLNLQADPTGLANGAYQGTVTVTPSVGTVVTISVTFNVGGGGTGTLTPSLNPVNLTYTTGGFFPSQFVTLTSNFAASTYTATATSSGGWLLVNGQTFVSGVSIFSGLTISAGSAVTGLATGFYTGTVLVQDNLGGVANITVNLTVNGGSSTGLNITPASLTFTAAVGGGTQFSNLTVTSSTGGVFTTTTSASWLSAAVTTGSPIASNTAGTVQVIVNPGGLSNGTYNGTVTVFVGAQSQAVPVTLTIGTGGGGSGGTTTGVAPTSVSLSWQVGTNPAFVNRPILAITGPSGVWGSSIAYAQGSGWLSLNASSGSSLPDQTTVVVNPAGLTAGNYAATITFTTPGGTQSVSVNLAVTTGPVLLSTPGGIVFTYQTGSNLPAGQTIFFSSSDGSQFELAGNVTSNVSWLTISSIQAGQKSFSISADPTGLSGGVYTGSITVAAASALPSVIVPVVLVINGGTGGGGSVGPLTFSPASLAFSVAAGNNPAAQGLGVIASAQTSFTAVGNQTWLVVTPASGVTNTSLTVSVNSSSLPSGTYNGVINFTANGVTQTVPVSLIVGTGSGTANITVTPSGGLTFTGQAGAGSPAAQSLQINSASGVAPVSFSVNVTTTSGGTWLSTSASTGTLSTPQTLTVTVNTSTLAAGTYQGNIQLTPASGTQVNVPITLTLTAASSVSVPSTPLAFTYRASGAIPAAQQLAVSGNGAALAFTATASTSNGGTWLAVLPSSGTTPATIGVSVTPTSLTTGTYSGSITVAGTNGATGSTTVPVTLVVSAPLPTVTRLGNAGSYAGASIAPGEIITLFGTEIGPTTPITSAVLDSTGKVATTLGGVQVTVNGFLAPMIAVSNTQVSAVVPYELAQFASANVLVRFLGQSSNGIAINVTTTAPGLFTANASGTGPGAILNQNNSPNSPSNPATRGQIVSVYLTGEGQTNPAGVTGKVTTVNATPPLTPQPLLLPSVLIGSQAADYTFYGEAPGLVSGVMQLNVTVPLTVGTGELPIVVSIGGNPSQAGVTVSVR